MPSALKLQSSVRQLAGVGPERATQLARLKISTIEDLLLHRPNRYEDRRHFISIAELKLKEPATVRGKIVAQGVNYYKKRTRSVFEFVLDDGTARLHCRWWNLPFMEKYFHVGAEVMVFGKPLSVRPRTIDHPETELLEPGEDASIHLDRIVPIYPLTEGLPQRWLRSLAWHALERFESELEEPWPELLKLPGHKFPARANAIHMLHFPEEEHDAEVARQRLAFDELFALQLEIQRRRRTLQKNATALPCGGTNELMRPFLARLGFKLTTAQTRVLREIRTDMSGAVPMRRLLQGDVGSGKTAVAACSALMALESGFNVALMAPTEILAEQHFQNFTRWFEPLGARVELQTGARKTVEHRRAALPPSSESRPSTLYIGTHALITPAFEMTNPGLVIIDEQHKFGVAQREQLVRKGRYPHLLVMTATPIPRTLGLTLYGDLDSSIIDELPAHRGQIRTFVRNHEQLPRVHEFIRGKLKEGQQAYIVYSRVDTADTEAGIKAVTEEFARLQKSFAPHRIALLHGRLNAQDKDSVMNAFRANRIQVLLATSVIEVGVDVPNATVMVIENAEQFGLAQLHQLRGRVGRGAHESFCILVANLKTENAAQRLRVLEQTTDGFEIAEADLKMRGPGELLGAAQSGLPPFRFADLLGDRALIECAREYARRFSPSLETQAAAKSDES
ncbi:MAG TPA: ATP-dependent DNA helicase RecG [Methylomirabilota bacterium]|nr:ATP-dependent DNA helicase RecG [Methylomirabilota bacterium]